MKDELFREKKRLGGKIQLDVELAPISFSDFPGRLPYKGPLLLGYFNASPLLHTSLKKHTVSPSFHNHGKWDVYVPSPQSQNRGAFIKRPSRALSLLVLVSFFTKYKAFDYMDTS